MQTEPQKIPETEDFISMFVTSITGLVPVEENNPMTYKLSLGTKDPVEISFHKLHFPDLSFESMRYSAYVKLLKTVSEYLETAESFSYWCKMNKDAEESKIISN